MGAKSGGGRDSASPTGLRASCARPETAHFTFCVDGVARIAVTCMKKSLLFFILSISCVVALRYFNLDFSWFAEAFAHDSGNIADMNQPMPHTVLPAVDE